jgi:hypothetical protein
MRRRRNIRLTNSERNRFAGPTETPNFQRRSRVGLLDSELEAQQLGDPGEILLLISVTSHAL